MTSTRREALLAGAAGVASLAWNPPAAVADAIPSTGVMFGTTEPAVGLAKREAQMGRSFDIFHDYMGCNFGAHTSPHPDHTNLLTVSSSLHSKGLTPVQDTLAGKNDSAIIALRTSITTPTFVAIWQEMNGGWMATNDQYIGGAANYVKAYRHAALILRQNTNIILTWTPNIWAFGGVDDPEPYYPGDDVVDWVGFDGYCHGTYHSFDQLFSKAVAAYGPSGSRHKHPFMVAETAAQKALTPDKYVTSVHSSLLAHSGQVRSVCWFDNPWGTNGYEVDATTAELAAYKNMVTDPKLLAA